ncbi:hypothetical protein [Sorangium cellulosum]|uniref:CBM11 domain-containing protein n=1 Tax=Sorangium cellulosum So0157-2 TaxID=1254432 RepID=S4XVQ6_SORCE|nr:hypothetical protein [Sorangium cellulosum]AGP35965.1 hypothetical protein SCE1572_16535 [Sorangium cellulosum So0157-2]
MRLRVLAAGLCASVLATGCGLVLGISSGEYDPDPFGLDGGAAGAGGTAGSGGAAGTGGAGGVGASDAGAEPPPCTALLDDLEDGDSAILRCQGRVGSWYTYNDGTRSGTQTPLPGRPFVPVSPGHDPSNYAAHVAGSGFVTRGAGMGFDLNLAPGGAKLSYDASAYVGLTFWAKAAAPTHIYVNFPDRNTDREGGVCEGSGCGDHFGEGLDLTTEWAQYTVMFSILSTDGWGVPAPPAFDAAHVYSIEFHTAKSTVFDMLVDDIAFVP